MKMVLAQTRVELLLTLRRGESLLVTVIVPSVLLLFFGSVEILPTGQDRPLDFVLPGILALAVISTGMVSLGIATAFERHYRVLKRLGGSPLSRAGLLTAKMLSVLVLELAQAAILIAIAVAVFGWRPTGSLATAVLAMLLGTSAFCGLGLWMAGSLRAEATLAVANGLYVGCVLLGDVVFPLSVLPDLVSAPARFLPAAALSDALRGSLVSGSPAGSAGLILLLGWAVATPLAAALTFHWE